jgi:hypothetical protein
VEKPLPPSPPLPPAAGGLPVFLLSPEAPLHGTWLDISNITPEQPLPTIQLSAWDSFLTIKFTETQTVKVAVVVKPNTCIREVLLLYIDWYTGFLDCGGWWFTSVPPNKHQVSTSFRSRPFHSNYFSIHYPLIIFTFVATESEISNQLIKYLYITVREAAIRSATQKFGTRNFITLFPKSPSFQYIWPHPISPIHLNIILHLVRRPLSGLLYQPRMIYDECGAVGGIRIGRGNRRTRRKPAPASLSPS